MSISMVAISLTRILIVIGKPFSKPSNTYDGMGSLVSFMSPIPSGNQINQIEKLNRYQVSLRKTKDYQEALVSSAKRIYKNTAGANLSALFCPYQSQHVASGDLGSQLPSLASGITDDGTINVHKLTPFKFNVSASGFVERGAVSGTYDSMTGLVSGPEYGGDLSKFRHDQNIRSIGLRSPLILVGWGYDTNDSPVPAGSGDGLFAGEVASGYMVDPIDYKVGPMDIRWNPDTGTWQAVSTGGIAAFASYFPSSPNEASGLGYLDFLPTLSSI